MDRATELGKVFRQARRYMHEGVDLKFSRPLDGFREFAAEAVDTLYRHIGQADDYYASVAGEVIPRLFAVDVTTGYSFFHDPEALAKIWDIYNTATAIVAGKVNARRQFRKTRPYKVAFVSSMFSDYIAPAKAIANFALHVDRAKFTPLMVVTNQAHTMERRSGYSVVPFSQMKLGKQLLENDIDIIGLPPQDNLPTLAQQLIELCFQFEVDMVVTNASPFSFPEACLARSGMVGSFFDMHRGFPLYVDGIDAILHWVAGTREKQLGLWMSKGGKVIDYHDGIAVPPLPEKWPSRQPGIVRFVTVSNYIEQRFSPEFCDVVSRVMRECPQTTYRIIGGCAVEEVKKRFAAEVRSRLEFTGPVQGADALQEHFLASDIYLNEFPVSGVRVCLEAMCACLPVVTMKCGDLHVNATSVEHVGSFAILENNPQRYYELAVRLVKDEAFRRQAGQDLRRRMETEYDYKVTLHDLAEKLLAVHEAKMATC